MKSFPFPSTKELTEFFNQQKNKKILVVSGNHSYKNSGADELLDKILSGYTVEYFFKEFAYPDSKELRKIISKVQSFSPDIILAVGGGSVIDYAKIANVFTDLKNLETNIINSSYNFKRKNSKLITIPTTAGSGAEVTSNAVIYIDNIKYSVEGEALKPDMFFLIPELVIKATNKIKSSAGFDAIAQALESLISKKSNLESVENAKESLKISLNNFIDFLNNPNDINTSAMCLAANLSGKAISISKTTAPHAISYPFTSLFNISHGHAVSLTLNKFLRFNFKNIEYSNCNFDLKERFKIMFDLTKTNNFESFDRFIKNLKQEANLEDEFSKLGIDIKQDFPKIISGVNVLRLSNNPIKLSKQDLKSILLNF